MHAVVAIAVTAALCLNIGPVLSRTLYYPLNVFCCVGVGNGDGSHIDVEVIWFDVCELIANLARKGDVRNGSCETLAQRTASLGAHDLGT